MLNNIKENIKNSAKKLDFLLLAPIIILSIFSILTLYDYNSSTLFHKQILWAIISLCLFIFISRSNLNFLENSKLVILIYIISMYPIYLN